MGVQASIFQIFCLLGYCLFPLNVSAIIVTLINFNDIIRLIIVCMSLFWSIHSSSDYLKIITKQEVRYLVLTLFEVVVHVSLPNSIVIDEPLKSRINKSVFK